MAAATTYVVKPATYEAIQYDGKDTTVSDIQTFTGSHALDKAGRYMVPNFDDAVNWWPDVDPTMPKVLWDGNDWVGVHVLDWIVKQGGSFSVMSNADFTAKFIKA